MPKVLGNVESKSSTESDMNQPYDPLSNYEAKAVLREKAQDKYIEIAVEEARHEIWQSRAGTDETVLIRDLNRVINDHENLHIRDSMLIADLQNKIGEQKMFIEELESEAQRLWGIIEEKNVALRLVNGTLGLVLVSDNRAVTIEIHRAIDAIFLALAK